MKSRRLLHEIKTGGVDLRSEQEVAFEAGEGMIAEGREIPDVMKSSYDAGRESKKQGFFGSIAPGFSSELESLGGTIAGAGALGLRAFGADMGGTSLLKINS